MLKSIFGTGRKPQKTKPSRDDLMNFARTNNALLAAGKIKPLNKGDVGHG